MKEKFGTPIHKQKPEKVRTAGDEIKRYDYSFPNHKKAWRHLVHATEYVGWKDIHYMVLRLQKELQVKGYKLRAVGR